MEKSQSLATTFDDSDLDELAALYKKIQGALGKDAKAFLVEAATGVVAMEGATDIPSVAVRNDAIKMVVDEATQPDT